MGSEYPIFDPKGLILESYRIEGIEVAECRSIFLDWALSLPPEIDTGYALNQLFERYRTEAPNHPMTEILRLGQEKAPTVQSRRRGGWRSRKRS